MQHRNAARRRSGCATGRRCDRRRSRQAIIHPSAPPNHLSPEELRIQPGADGVTLAIDPERAGWRYLSFRALALQEGERIDLGGPGHETVVVVLAGGGASIELNAGYSFELKGRATVFEGKPWAASTLCRGRQC